MRTQAGSNLEVAKWLPSRYMKCHASKRQENSILNAGSLCRVLSLIRIGDSV
jgi:hypothetical protein